MPIDKVNQSIYDEVVVQRQQEKNEKIKAKINLLISKIEFAEEQKRKIENNLLELKNKLKMLLDGEDADLQEFTADTCCDNSSNFHLLGFLVKK